MTPAARTQAAIDLLDAIIASARAGGAAADTLIARWFAERRYAGSKDRRAVRALVYRAIRAFGEPPASGRTAMVALAADDPDLAASFDGSPYGPAPLAHGEPVAEAGVAPAWLAARLAASGIEGDQLRALLDRAPLDIRINRLPADAIHSFDGAEPIAGLPDALRLPPDSVIDRDPAFVAGAVEVQDAGSQWVAMACDARPAMAVVDLCAGAGGKTLALAASMRNDGAILASDTDRARLSRLSPRADRAGVTIATTRLLNPGQEAAALSDWQGRADRVVIDAPCSGTGTWRRNPEARWRLTPARLDRLADTQARLLDIGASLVRPGGLLIHIVCSLLDAEGADQVAAFLSRYPEWTPETPAIPGERHGHGMRLTPASHATDGFFVATVRAP